MQLEVPGEGKAEFCVHRGTRIYLIDSLLRSQRIVGTDSQLPLVPSMT